MWMTTVKECLAQKGQQLIAVKPQDKVRHALELMRDNQVRAVLVMEGNKLNGIITQGDCAIKLLLPGLDARQAAVMDFMTPNPMVVKPSDPLEACMGLMASRNFRHLPVLDGDKVAGVISIGDVVKDSIRQLGSQVSMLETYIKGHGA
jgi:CBS domain-containing protein